MPEPLRLIISEDNYLVREGTRQLLESGDDVRVLAAVGDKDQLLSAVERLEPDAVLTDIRMPPEHHMEGIEAAHDIRSRHPGVGVVVLSQHAAAPYALALFEHGTSGLAYLLKERVTDRSEIVRALRETVAGRSVTDPEIVDALVSRRARQSSSPLRHLSPRELDVLAGMARGLTNTAIADELHLSRSSIEKHITTIFASLGLSQDRSTIDRRVAAVLTYLSDTSRPAPEPPPNRQHSERAGS